MYEFESKVDLKNMFVLSVSSCQSEVVLESQGEKDCLKEPQKRRNMNEFTQCFLHLSILVIVGGVMIVTCIIPRDT